MGKDCFFSFSPELDPLVQDFCETSSEVSAEKFIVSNLPRNTEVYSPEINFYLSCTTTSLQENARALRNMYESRLDRFDFSKQGTRKTAIQKTIGLIGLHDQHDLIDQLTEKGFSVFSLQSDSAVEIHGEIGNFIIQLNDKKEKAGQLIWQNMPQHLRNRPGCYTLEELSTNELIDKLEGTGSHAYCTTDVHCQKSSCVRYSTGEKYCSACIDACPQQAIETANDGSPVILHSVCIGCGRCVSACPNGAMESTTMPRTRIHEIVSHFKGYNLLLIPRRTELAEFNISLPENVLPFLIDDENLLDEESLLCLCQSTTRQAIVYIPDQLDSALEKRIDFINTIMLKTLKQQAIYTCIGKEELCLALENTDFAAIFEQFVPYGGINKRQDLAHRLEKIIGNGDYGVIETEPASHLGLVHINTEKCTLCLSCVGKCPMNALSANSEDLTLRFTPSLCIQCGACTDTCPEKECLSLAPGGFSLSQRTFTSRVLARDELFSCIECNRQFAPKRAVDKIASKMSGHFSNDPVKLKSLSCCPDCKARLMLEQQLSIQSEEIRG